MVPPVLFVNDEPMSGVREPLKSVPRALSVLPLVPKLYVSPAVEVPVPAVYLPSTAAAVRELVIDGSDRAPFGQSPSGWLDRRVQRARERIEVLGVCGAERGKADAPVEVRAGIWRAAAGDRSGERGRRGGERADRED